jgi:exodeoxyribonuclease V alpha subunit
MAVSLFGLGNTEDWSATPMTQRPTTYTGTLTVRNEKGEWFAGFLETDRWGEIPVTGTASIVPDGAVVVVRGSWRAHARFGEQFRIDIITLQDAKSATALILRSGWLKGVKDVMAERIYEMYGDTVFDHMNVDDLQRVKGIGPINVQPILESWEAQKHTAQAVRIGLTVGLSLQQIKKASDLFGGDFERVVKDTPYELTRIENITFKDADRIAIDQNHPRTAQDRYVAGTVEVLQDATHQGHTFLPRQEAYPKVIKLLGEDTQRDLWMSYLQAGAAFHDRRIDLIQEHSEVCIADHSLQEVEKEIAADVRRLLAAKPEKKASAQGDPLIKSMTTVPLTDEQIAAVRLVLNNNLVVLTGGPGTGKSTILKAAIGVFDANFMTVLCGAPTGKAANRIKEATGHEAMTVHRLLGWKGEFTKDADDPIDAAVVVIDEASMLDTFLAHALLDAIKSGRRIVLVGDADQLPPVGPGQVLRDLIESGCVPVARLTQVHRQAQGSGIIMNAHHLNKGEPMQLSGWTDFAWMETKGDRIVDLVTDVLPQRGMPADSVTVLASLKRDVTSLNDALQESLNPTRRFTFGFRKLSVGDPVRHTKNNYDLNVFNGETGRIIAIMTPEEIKTWKERNGSWEDAPRVVTVQYPG